MILAAAVLLAVLPARAGLEREEVVIRSVRIAFNLTNDGEALLRAVRAFENGRPGNECGYETDNRWHVAGNPLIPPDGVQYAKAASAIVQCLQAWVLRDEWRRRQFLRYLAERYHAGGAGQTPEAQAAANVAYSRTLSAVFLRERRTLLERRSAASWSPFDRAEQEEAAREAAAREGRK